MSENQEKQGYYEQKGMVRQMFIMTEATKERLKQVAKRFSLTQGEVLEVLIDHIDEDALAPVLQEKRALKIADRDSAKAAIIKKIRKMSPKQLAVIEQIVKDQ